MQQQMMTGRESPRLAALVHQHVGWQIDDLRVMVDDRGLTLRGRARTAVARALAEVEAARLSGLPVVENGIELRPRTGRATA
jgi:hypothetical protein